METTTTEKHKPLTVHSSAEESVELEFNDPSAKSTSDVSPALQKQADEILLRLMTVDAKNLSEQKSLANSVSSIGHSVQKELSKQSEMLKAPMATLMKDAEDGGKVANSLLDLQAQVNEINPNKIDFSMGAVRKILAKIPGVGTPLARWFAKYQAVDSVINDIIASLKDGRKQLSRDNSILSDDQIRMRELIFKLQDYVSLAQLLDDKLSSEVAKLPAGDEKRMFLEEEVLFPLKQRILDLQTQLGVNQQGVLATGVIIKNNKELMIGVDRALNVTTTALNTAATLQIALQHQKKVLTGVKAVTQTTDDLIAGTAEQLKTQGVEIQKQAAEATLDIAKLKQSFLDVQTALDDISSFRRNALPKMAESIVEMDSLTNSMEESIQKYEKGVEISKDSVFEIVDSES
ncbi:MAG: toxic anion resistance protein [Acidiferrobacterales bacterium]|nr:toxic anion resistance protein [Acidiferrobacterales bacterium]